MYSRATPFQKADKIAGTHQKIDRAARLVLREIISKNQKLSKIHFPIYILLFLPIFSLLSKVNYK